MPNLIDEVSILYINEECSFDVLILNKICYL